MISNNFIQAFEKNTVKNTINCVYQHCKTIVNPLKIVLCLSVSVAPVLAQTPAELMASMQSDTSTPALTIRNSSAPQLINSTPKTVSAPSNIDKPVRTTAPVETEFQRFIQRTTGKALQPYGSQLFTNPDFLTDLNTNETTPVNADYVLGVGDEVVIRAWGSIDVDFSSSIDRNGQIVLPKVGIIRLAGVKSSQLEPMIQQIFSRFYRGFHMNVTLGKLRPVRVYVVGQAIQPKMYTMPAMSTVLSAIFASGGPSSKGSMRNIVLQRHGKPIVTFDVYDFLLKGDRSKDVDLRDGDTLVFSNIGARIAVLGATDAPYIYELKNEEHRLANILNYVGGLNATTSLYHASIERLNPSKDTARSLIKINLDPTSQQTITLKDGDILTLQPIREEFENVVTLRGNVALPLRYPHREQMRISDLIPDRQALITADYFARKNILVQAVQAQPNVSANDKPASSAEVVLQDSLNLADNINWDYAVIERLKPDLTVELIPFNLGKAVLERDEAHNLVLNAGDIVSVFSNRDLRMAQSKLSRTIKLDGEFNAGGVYQVQPNETLLQLIQRVGGLTDKAYVYGTVFSRRSAQANQQKAMNTAIEKLERDLSLQSLTRAASTDNASQAAQASQASQQFVNQLKSIKASGRIAMDIPAVANLSDLPDIEIEDGDTLYIPSKPSTVSIIGAVHNENTVLHVANKPLKQYLSQAGDLTPTADSDNIYVLRANGSVVRKTNGWLGWLGSEVATHPGDTIVVPENINRFDTLNNYKNWASVFSQFALGVASLKVLGIY
jgi:protein involved in polysaccharide export with SLBB domain